MSAKKPVAAPEEAYHTGSSAPAESDRSLERDLGIQIRALRRKLDLTASDVASAAGLSVSMMSKIENGQISASLTTLQALARALNTSVSNLFLSAEESRDCSYVPANQGVLIERRGTKVGHQYQLLGHALGGDVAVEPYLITLTEEAVPYTGFRHAGVEFIYMLSGEVSYRHADRSYHLRPGDSLLFDSAGIHGPEDLIKRPMTYLSIIIYSREPR